MNMSMYRVAKKKRGKPFSEEKGKAFGGMFTISGIDCTTTIAKNPLNLANLNPTSVLVLFHLRLLRVVRRIRRVRPDRGRRPPVGLLPGLVHLLPDEVPDEDMSGGRPDGRPRRVRVDLGLRRQEGRSPPLRVRGGQVGPDLGLLPRVDRPEGQVGPGRAAHDPDHLGRT